MNSSAFAAILLVITSFFQLALASPDRSHLGTSVAVPSYSEHDSTLLNKSVASLDHGPRAVTTPWNSKQNKSGSARFESSKFTAIAQSMQTSNEVNTLNEGHNTVINTQHVDVPATTEKMALPLDHGPRAVTTPWNNRKKLEELNAQKTASNPVK